MRKFVRETGLIAMLALAGCAADGSLTPAAQAQVAAVCAKDAAGQPMVAADVAALATLGVLVPQGAGVAAGVNTAVVLDQAVVHPAVQAACAKVLAPVPAK